MALSVPFPLDAAAHHRRVLRLAVAAEVGAILFGFVVGPIWLSVRLILCSGGGIDDFCRGSFVAPVLLGVFVVAECRLMLRVLEAYGNGLESIQQSESIARPPAWTEARRRGYQHLPLRHRRHVLWTLFLTEAVIGAFIGYLVFYYFVDLPPFVAIGIGSLSVIVAFVVSRSWLSSQHLGGSISPSS